MPHDDQKYIDALVNRNEPLIEDIYQKYGPECKRFVLLNGASIDDAYCIFKEALKAISLLHQSKPIELQIPFGAYLYSVYSNLWINKIKPEGTDKQQNITETENEKPISHDDQKYIDALVNRNEPLVSEVYKKYGPACKRFVLRNGGTVDDAQDIFQEALIAVTLRHQSKPIVLRVPFGGYLYRVYKNLWINYIRKRKKDEPINLIDTMKIDDPFSLYGKDKELQFIILKESFSELKRECKELLGMRMIDLSVKEIAKELSIKPNNVDQKMYTCRERLRKCCEDHPLYKQL